MRGFVTFAKKELLEHWRSGKCLLLLILFALLGVMNPAIAKLTPWMMELFAETLAESGMTVTAVEVTAMDSWMQFYKNLPIALIAFALIESNAFTGEYGKGTLLLLLPRGLTRHQVLLAKTAVLFFFWSASYWLTFGITYGYNAYFWDNSIAQSLGLSVLGAWVFGTWAVAMIVFFSTLSNASSGVLLGTGGCVLLSFALGFIPKLQPYVPTRLLDGTSLLSGAGDTGTYASAVLITLALTVACLVAALPIFQKEVL
jgi:ABC-2 type transport system permease protein